MPEVEPVTVRIRADTTELKTGLEQGKIAMRSFGDETANTALKLKGTADSSRALFSGLVQMRVASVSTQRVLKELGVTNEYVSRTFEAMNLVMDAAIAISAIYRAAKVAEKIVTWLVTKAKFAEMAATMGISTFGAGAIVGLGIAAATIAAVAALPEAQHGGIVPARMGGTPVLVGEAGKAEAIVPLDELGRGIGGGIHINIERMETSDPREFVRMLGREIELAKLAGA